MCVAALGFIPFVLIWDNPVLMSTATQPAISPVNFLLQFTVYTVTGDFLHYITHRFLHTPLLRKYIHHLHHEYEGPLYSWIGMQVHPIEVVMITIAIYSPFVLLSHPFVLWTFTFLATINATVAHSGYDVGFFSVFVPIICLSSADHQLHHDHNSTKNFGNIFNIWDRWFKTYKSGATTS